MRNFKGIVNTNGGLRMTKLDKYIITKMHSVTNANTNMFVRLSLQDIIS